MKDKNGNEIFKDEKGRVWIKARTVPCPPDCHLKKWTPREKVILESK